MPVKQENMDDLDGTRHFMVNVIEPQFNLHSEDANVSNKTADFYLFVFCCFNFKFNCFSN